jgi:methionyl-tRNA synthetase
MVHRFTDLWQALNITNTGFIRTTDEQHKKVVRHIFEKVLEKGDIYLGEYEDWYCVPCEAYYTELQLKDGLCPDCLRKPEKLKEESYFFKLSKYTQPLLDLLEKQKDFFLPDIRYNEVASFVNGGLRDLSISRTSFQWGIPVPGNEKHIVYVWFDALPTILTGVGFLEDTNNSIPSGPATRTSSERTFSDFIAVYWPSFLMSYGLTPPKHIFAHGW